ncbi:MAG: hypothetical protein RR406_03155 [Bacilli bacterium]
MSWIDFNNINSDEVFNNILIITKRIIGTPTPKSYAVEVPFSSKVIDYSYINGPIFNNRTIEIGINIEGYDRVGLYNLYGRVLSWLMRPNYSKLVLSDIEGYYMAKLKNISSLEEISFLGNLTIVFECYPWRYEEDIEYLKILNRNDSIYLNGSFMPYTPTIEASGVCNIEYEGKTYSLKKGVNREFDIVFKEGMNEIKLLTDGAIEFNISYKLGGL